MSTLYQRVFVKKKKRQKNIDIEQNYFEHLLNEIKVQSCQIKKLAL